jgi:hypothetical protein
MRGACAPRGEGILFYVWGQLYGYLLGEDATLDTTPPTRKDLAATSPRWKVRLPPKPYNRPSQIRKGRWGDGVQLPTFVGLALTEPTWAY